jgi:hypothetical protein
MEAAEKEHTDRARLYCDATEPMDEDATGVLKAVERLSTELHAYHVERDEVPRDELLTYALDVKAKTADLLEQADATVALLEPEQARARARLAGRSPRTSGLSSAWSGAEWTMTCGRRPRRRIRAVPTGCA